MAKRIVSSNADITLTEVTLSSRSSHLVRYSDIGT
jgi:hypothetical protein